MGGVDNQKKRESQILAIFSLVYPMCIFYINHCKLIRTRLADTACWTSIDGSIVNCDINNEL